MDLLWLPRLPKRTLWQYIQHAALCVQHPSRDGSAVTALETMYLGTPLLLGPADYDHDLLKQVPRTHLVPDEMAKNIVRILEPRSNRDDRTLIRLNADEKTQSIEMKTC
jgi:hypothetical protein